MNQPATADQAKSPISPMVFVGDRTHDERIVMRRVFTRVTIRTPDRSLIKSKALEEIPLLRKLYSYYGGKVTVFGGVAHPVIAKKAVQEMNEYQLENHLAYLIKAYNGVVIEKQKFDFFDDVYGKGADCNLLRKMKALAQEWNSCFLDEIVRNNVTDKTELERIRVQDAQMIENLLAKHFPHVARESRPNVLHLADMQGLEAPEIGSNPISVDEEPVAAAPVHPPIAPEPAAPASLAEEQRVESVLMTGEAAPDVDLVSFLMNPDHTEGKPYSKEQAHGIAAVSMKKPCVDWTAEDLGPVPDLTGRNLQRVVRLVESFYREQVPQGAGAPDLDAVMAEAEGQG